MRILAPITLFNALRDWGLHEAEGRLPAMRLIDPAFVDALRRGGEDMAISAAEICLQFRSPVIVRVLAADPTEYVQVELTNGDIDQLFVMSAEGQPRRPLGLHAEGPGGHDEEDEWPRKRIAERVPVEGPLFAVGRAVPGDLTLLDGLHRAAVWVKHAATGFRYPITANVAITFAPRLVRGLLKQGRPTQGQQEWASRAAIAEVGHRRGSSALQAVTPGHQQSVQARPCSRRAPVCHPL